MDERHVAAGLFHFTDTLYEYSYVYYILSTRFSHELEVCVCGPVVIRASRIPDPAERAAYELRVTPSGASRLVAP